MPRIGIHTSIAGSLARSAERAAELGCDALQIFSSSPRMWRAATPTGEVVREFRSTREKHGLAPLVIHDNYLINLPAADAIVRARSIDAFRGELERAIALGADYLVMHPGSYCGGSREQALDRFAVSLAEAARGLRLNGLRVLFENTAGGGCTMGREPAELLELRRRAEERVQTSIGFCVDTAHCFQSGQDFFAVVKELGIENVPVIHTNDSKTAFGSRHDRHEQIGKGGIGLEGFRKILRHPRLRGKAFILETPRPKPGDDRRNVEAVRRLAQGR